jgi:long-chain acyl-CoA synthetase
MELGLTSLGEVELSVALEEAYGVVLDGTDLAGIATVGELLARVEQGGSSTGKAIAFPAWSLRPWAVHLRSVLQHLLLFPLHRLLARPFSVAFTTPLAEPRTPAVYIANHCSHVDTLSIIRAMPPQHRARLAIAAASDYFYASPYIGALATAILNTFPFAREGSTRASLEYCGDLVDQGWSILIYPEGTRSTTGHLLPFKRGIGLLAAGLEVPVVPIAVRGGYEILPKGRRSPRPGPVSLLFGAPEQADPDADPDALTVRLHGVMERLLEAGPD